MRCLLDKVIARYALQGLLKLAEGQHVNDKELFTLDLFERAIPQQIDLFIAPPTANILHKIAQFPEPMTMAQFLVCTLSRRMISQ